MQKAIIHIGASGLQRESLLWAKESGLYLIATDINPQAEGQYIADEFHNISGTDVESLLNLAKDISRNFLLVGVYCNSDFSLEAASYINQEYGLMGCNPQSVKLSIDKTKAKQLMNSNDVPVPEGITIDSSFSNFENMNLKFPVIVKPEDSCGSQGVRYINNITEIQEGIKKALSFSKKVLIEEFIDGTGVDTIGIMNNGKLLPCGIGMRFFSELPYRFPIHGYSATDLSRADQEKAYLITEQAALSVGIINGPVKADLIYEEGKFTIIEVTPRFHGDVFTNKMIFYATGFNPAKELFYFMRNGTLTAESILDINPKCVMWKGLFPLETEIDWSSIKNKDIPGGRIIDFYLKPNSGTNKSEHIDNTSLSGFMWLEFEDNNSLGLYLKNFKSIYNAALL